MSAAPAPVAAALAALDLALPILDRLEVELAAADPARDPSDADAALAYGQHQARLVRGLVRRAVTTMTIGGAATACTELVHASHLGASA